MAFRQKHPASAFARTLRRTGAAVATCFCLSATLRAETEMLLFPRQPVTGSGLMDAFDVLGDAAVAPPSMREALLMRPCPAKKRIAPTYPAASNPWKPGMLGLPRSRCLSAPRPAGGRVVAWPVPVPTSAVAAVRRTVFRGGTSARVARLERRAVRRSPRS